MSSREVFLEECKKLQQRIDRNAQSIRDYEACLTQALETYKNGILQSITTDAGIFKEYTSGGDTALKALEGSMDEVRDQMRRHCDDWSARIESTKKNMAFRRDFGDSLLVYVYGRVKTGKSSLGNYVAWGKIQPDENDVQAGRNDTEFGVRTSTTESDSGLDRNTQKLRDQILREKQFAVDFLEATSCIQYFKKPGITWIDSPGIHSLTEANGKLAKEYLKCADVVIFTTQASSACREDERQELTQIRHPPFLLMATRCDNLEKDEDENGNIIDVITPKSDKEKTKIIDWCVKSVGDELNMNEEERQKLRSRTLPVSCYLAETRGEKESGFDVFFDRLLDVLSSDGLKAKKNAPLKATLEHLEAVEKDILADKDLLRKMRGLLEQVAWQFDRFSREETQTRIDALKAECQWITTEYIKSRSTEEFMHNARTAAENAVAGAMNAMAKAIDAELCRRLSGWTFLMPDLQLPALRDEPAYVVRHNNSGSTIGGTAGSVIAGLGGLLLGPRRSAVAAGLGGLVGRFIGSFWDEDVYEKVITGTNACEVERKLMEELSRHVQNGIRQGTTVLKRTVLEPRGRSLDGIEKSLDALFSTLEQQKAKLTKEIEA